MVFSNLLYLSIEQRKLFREKVFSLLETYGVKLDPHPEMFKKLKSANLQVDEVNGMVRFPSRILEELLQQAPKSFVLGSKNRNKSLPLPRPDGAFYARACTGAPGFLDPETGKYRTVTLRDTWARIQKKGGGRR